MTLTTVPVMSTHGQYAIAHARATIHDGGIADLVDLEFDAGYSRRAHIAPGWLRLGDALSGRWLITLYFRTAPDGRLKEMPFVTAIRQIEEHDPVFAWEAIGRLTLLDPDSGRATFRVRPSAPTIKPFLLTTVVPEALQVHLQRDQQYRLSGTLQEERLLTATIDLIEVQE